MFSVKDVVSANSQRNEKIKSTDDVIRLINKSDIAQICISAHPERWNDSFGAWLKELVWQNMKNAGKGILVRRSSGINEKLVSKLSYLVERLKETKGTRIFKRGSEKAVVLLSRGEDIFAWAPWLRE